MEKEELLRFVIDEMKKPQNKRLDYNIFDVLDVSHREVIICRFLADLLNPKGAHGKGDRFLRPFIDNVLSKDGKINWTEEDYKYVRVYSEYPIAKESQQSKRRIDIVIKSDKRFIPIEVKIYAKDQEAQCYDYWKYAKDRNTDKHAYIWYLTREGTPPTEYSASSRDGVPLLNDKIRLISFRNDILKWAEQLRENSNDSFTGVLDQFIEAIKLFVGGGLVMNISEELSKSPESYKAGRVIADSINGAKKILVKKILGDLDNRIKSELNLERSDIDYYEYEKYSDEYGKDGFGPKAEEDHPWPGINYVLPISFNDPVLKDVKLVMRAEIFKTLWVGVVAINAKDKMTCLWEEINRRFESEHLEKKNNWNIFLMDKEHNSDPSGRIGDDIPDFANMNDSAISLFDDNERNCFIDAVVGSIKRNIYNGAYMIPKENHKQISKNSWFT